MQRIWMLAFLSLCSAFPMDAQSAAKPEFEVASIKPSAPSDGRMMMMGCKGGPGTKDPVLYTCQNTSISNLVTFAYGIDYYLLTAPDWTKTTRFDLRAKVPEGAGKDDLKLMIQALLLDRFKLAVHRELKDMAKYELVVAKNGPKLRPAAPPKPDDGTPKGVAAAPAPLMRDKDGYPILRGGSTMAVIGGKARMYDSSVTMAGLAKRLGGQLGKPVTDSTGLTGSYEVSLYWAMEMNRSAPVSAATSTAMPAASAPEGDTGPTLIRAIQDQLGLRLESTKGPVELLVIDHVEKSPSEN